jgi:NADH:ubiquinone oxidoreductase subunit K
MLQQLLIFVVLLVLVLNLVYFFGERRIMVFFIYLEVVHVLLILSLLTSTVVGVELLPMYLTVSLFIIGVSGAETAVLLVLFMAYFRVTGLTKFEVYKGRR